MKKLTIIIGLTLLSSLFISLNFSFKTYATTGTADVNNDGVVDIKDLSLVARSYNLKKSDNIYQANYDLNSDGIIDIYDMALVSKQIGTSIPIHVESVSLNKTGDTLTVGDTDTLTAKVNPSTAANQNISWTSSNTSIVNVDNNGKLSAISAGTAVITAASVDGNKTSSCTVTVNNRKGYVSNPNVDIDLKVRSDPSLNGAILGYLYNYQKIEILDMVTDSNNNVWDKINYNNGFAYVSNAYIQLYTSPPDNVINIASKITKQFEIGSSNQIAGNFDGQGLSLGYLQWCIGQETLQPLLNRMDRQYNNEMQNIFGTNYTSIHNMTLDTKDNQLKWAESINDSSNNIIEPWNTDLINLTKNQDFIGIETDAQVYTVNQAMSICNKYNLKTVRGFALAFDIVNQNGSISSSAANIIDSAIKQSPNTTEKELLNAIANAVIDTSTNNTEDIRSRKMAIVNGEGTVHGIMLYLDRDYGLSDDCWR